MLLQIYHSVNDNNQVTRLMLRLHDLKIGLVFHPCLWSIFKVICQKQSQYFLNYY